jgi:hypothetical protein
MTMTVSAGLRRIIIDVNCINPADILSKLNIIIKTSLHLDTEHTISDDGLDASICYINLTNKIITFAGAKLFFTFWKQKT